MTVSFYKFWCYYIENLQEFIKKKPLLVSEIHDFYIKRWDYIVTYISQKILCLTKATQEPLLKVLKLSYNFIYEIKYL